MSNQRILSILVSTLFIISCINSQEYYTTSGTRILVTEESSRSIDNLRGDSEVCDNAIIDVISPNSVLSFGSSGIDYAQTFIPSASKITGIKLVGFGSSNPPQDITINIHNGSDPNTAPVIASTICTTSAIQTNEVFVRFDSPVDVIPGNTYIFSLNGAENVQLNFGANFNEYPDGIVWLRVGEEALFQSVFDIAFETIECPRPIPTLSQWGIIVLSIIMLIFGLVFMRQRRVIFG